MYFVDDDTARCGYYECTECGYRFLSPATTPKTPCPLCAEDVDFELGPDETLEAGLETAELREVVEGEENVARYDSLLSVAYETDDSWI